jgi:hypothetical protein
MRCESMIVCGPGISSLKWTSFCSENPSLPLSNLQPGFLDGLSYLILIEDRSCAPNTEIPSARSGQRTRAASNSTRDCVNLSGVGTRACVYDPGWAWGSLPRSWQLWLGGFFNIRGVSLRSSGLWRKLVLSRPSRCRFRAAAGPSKFQVQVPGSQNVPHDPSSVHARAESPGFPAAT